MSNRVLFLWWTRYATAAIRSSPVLAPAVLGKTTNKQSGQDLFYKSIAIHASHLVIYNQDIKVLNQKRKCEGNGFRIFNDQFLSTGHWSHLLLAPLHGSRESNTSSSMPETCLLLNSLSYAQATRNIRLHCLLAVPEINHYSVDDDLGCV